MSPVAKVGKVRILLPSRLSLYAFLHFHIIIIICINIFIIVIFFIKSSHEFSPSPNSFWYFRQTREWRDQETMRNYRATDLPVPKKVPIFTGLPLILTYSSGKTRFNIEAAFSLFAFLAFMVKDFYRFSGGLELFFCLRWSRWAFSQIGCCSFSERRLLKSKQFLIFSRYTWPKYM